ncbi:MAG: type II toxin-antitoxin system PemK/MazF family toxin [Endomicrobium sp.]|jgi:mRNA-degrading endonuclease toxin of MazEF toxin-antitoxin module|nr:type II toxin-antitoxin system PemK/MazF family toxin [Endomicrobium sp.]
MNIDQGDILKVEQIGSPVLVVSKNSFNQSEQSLCCPIVKKTFSDPLHIPISSKEIEGVVQCEQIKIIDLKYRGCSKIGSLDLADIMNITDAIQGIFDYY